MNINDDEALACLRILALVARADGSVHNDERKSLAAALESLELPSGISVDALLEADAELDEQLALVTTPEARDQLYRSAYFMAHADGACTREEQAMLARIAEATGVTAEQESALAALFSGQRGSSPGLFATTAIDDPDERAAKVKSQVMKYAVLTAVLGAFPIPGVALATDLGVIALQLKMVRDIGGYWGREVDAKRARSILYSLGLGTGARLAIANFAKLVPGWGSAVGATTSFASTYALGKVIDKFFSTGVEDVADASAMKEELGAATKEGKKVFAEQESVIADSHRATSATLEALAGELKAGKITQAEFDDRVATL